MEMNPNPDPDVLISSFLQIQREIFVNVCALFSENVNEKNKNMFKRATDFSKDFNNCEPFDFRCLVLSEENFPIFCNFCFDFMNYVRKLDGSLFSDSVEYARNKLRFPTMPTLDMSVAGCGQSLSVFLDMRENNKLPFLNNGEEYEQG